MIAKLHHIHDVEFDIIYTEDLDNKCSEFDIIFHLTHKCSELRNQ